MEEVHSLVRHGGGYTFTDVWHLPVFFRRYFIDLIIKENDAQKAKQEKEINKSKNKK